MGNGTGPSSLSVHMARLESNAASLTVAAFDSSGSDQNSYSRDEEDMEVHVGDRRGVKQERSKREAGHQSAPTSEGLSFTTNYHPLRYKVVIQDKMGQAYHANCSFFSCSVDNFN